MAALSRTSLWQFLLPLALLMLVACSAPADPAPRGPTEPSVVHPLAVATSGEGQVVSDPVGIDCGDTCEAEFDQDTEVTLTAAPVEGWTFAGWEDDCSGTQDCVLTMDADKEVSATFEEEAVEPDSYILTIHRAGSGSGTVTSSPPGIDCDAAGVSCSAEFEEGSTVNLTATPSSASVLEGWQGCDGMDGNECEVEMDRDRTVTVTFSPLRHGLTVERTGSGSGSVTSSPPGIDCGDDCDYDFTHGTVVTLTAQADDGSIFAGWQEGCDSTSNNRCTVSMEDERTVKARFSVPPPPGSYSLSVNKTGSGSGTVTSDPPGIDCGDECAHDYLEDSEVTLTAEAHAGSTFTGWEGCDAVLEDECFVAMADHRTVTATFSEIRHTLTVNRSGTGSGTVTSSPSGIDCGDDCSHDYGHGTTVTLSAAPASNSTFAGWGGACTGTSTTCAVTMDQARTVTATFTLQQHTLSYLKQGDGEGTVNLSPPDRDCDGDCSETYDHGTEVTLTASAAEGSAFDGWGGACSGTRSTCTVTMTSARSVVAAFSVVHHTLEVTVEGSGSVTGGGIDCPGACTGSYPHGIDVTLTAEPTDGWGLVEWAGDCSGDSATCILTMDEDKSVTATFEELTGSLHVDVTGLPEGDADVLVTGPDGFERHLTESATLEDLEPGSYSISGEFVKVGISRYRYNPEPPEQTIEVDGDATATVKYVDHCADPDNVVEVPDANVETAIRSQLDKHAGDITCGDVQSLTALAFERVFGRLDSFDGLQYATNLTAVSFYKHVIGNLAPLSELPSLTRFYSRGSGFDDFESLSLLTNLTELTLQGSVLYDITPLADLTKLTHLDLGKYFGNYHGNRVSDISPLANMAQLRWLNLNYNRNITDLSPLANMTELTHLYLMENQITDVSPLANLTNLTEVSLGGDGLGDFYLYHGSNDIKDISPLGNLPDLTLLDLADNAIGDVGPLEGISNLTNLGLSGNLLSNITPLVENPGLGEQSRIRLIDNCLDLSEGSHASAQIEELRDRGVTLLYEPQRELTQPPCSN